jgi:hypothetical protein
MARRTSPSQTAAARACDAAPTRRALAPLPLKPLLTTWAGERVSSAETRAQCEAWRLPMQLMRRRRCVRREECQPSARQLPHTAESAPDERKQLRHSYLVKARGLQQPAQLRTRMQTRSTEHPAVQIALPDREHASASKGHTESKQMTRHEPASRCAVSASRVAERKMCCTPAAPLPHTNEQTNQLTAQSRRRQAGGKLSAVEPGCAARWVATIANLAKLQCIQLRIQPARHSTPP